MSKQYGTDAGCHNSISVFPKPAQMKVAMDPSQYYGLEDSFSTSADGIAQPVGCHLMNDEPVSSTGPDLVTSEVVQVVGESRRRGDSVEEMFLRRRSDVLVESEVLLRRRGDVLVELESLLRRRGGDRKRPPTTFPVLLR